MQSQLVCIFQLSFHRSSQAKQNVVARAIREVERFEALYMRFRRNLSISGLSEETLAGYGRHLSTMSLYFGRTPLNLKAEEVQDYLYALQNRSKTPPSQTCFKHTVFGLRFLLKSEGLAYERLLLPTFGTDCHRIACKE